MKKKTKQIAGLLTLLIPLLVWLFLPHYLKNALVHQLPGIDDHKIFSNRVVTKSSHTEPWPFSVKYNKKHLQKEFLDSLTVLETTAFIAIQNDSLIYEYYADATDTTQRTNSFSMAKSIISLLIGCAIDDGYINSVDQSIESLLPEFSRLHGHGLTLRHLLTMSSASDWNETYSSPLSVTTQAYYGDNLTTLMQGVKIASTPGQTFSYRSGDTQLLAFILKATTGLPPAQYAAIKLWQPLGAESDALWSLDHKNGMEKAYCCFNSNARDFARIGQLVLNHGNWKGVQVVDSDYIAEATHPATYLKDKQNNTVNYYGYQWWMVQIDGESIPYARGILGQYIFIIPSKNAVIVRLGRQRSDIKTGVHPQDVFTWLKAGLSVID